MLVEKWPGRNNFPKFVNNDKPDTGPRPLHDDDEVSAGVAGQFTFEDHEAPWSIVAPGIDLNITNLPKYHGTATFKGGTVRIQDHLPMWADFTAAFELDGPRVHLPRIDIATDGAETTASGDVDFAHWPNMTFAVKSRVHFPRMREIFFTDEKWRIQGDGDFDGTFRLYDHGHNVSGKFTGQNAGVNALQFPGLFGTLQWNEHGFDVWNAGAKFYGGDSQFQYSIKPLGVPAPPTQRLRRDGGAHRPGAVLGSRADAEGPALRRRGRRARVSRMAVGQVQPAQRRRLRLSDAARRRGADGAVP